MSFCRILSLLMLICFLTLILLLPFICHLDVYLRFCRLGLLSDWRHCLAWWQRQSCLVEFAQQNPEPEGTCIGTVSRHCKCNLRDVMMLLQVLLLRRLVSGGLGLYCCGIFLRTIAQISVLEDYCLGLVLRKVLLTDVSNSITIAHYTQKFPKNLSFMRL